MFGVVPEPVGRIDARVCVSNPRSVRFSTDPFLTSVVATMINTSDTVTWLTTRTLRNRDPRAAGCELTAKRTRERQARAVQRRKERKDDRRERGHDQREREYAIVQVERQDPRHGRKRRRQHHEEDGKACA